jgi:membrane protein YdbS with pleckstrin-like domain
MHMRRSTMFLISSILCFLLAIYTGFLAYIITYAELPRVIFLFLSVFEFIYSIVLFSRSRYYKKLESTGPK